MNSHQKMILGPEIQMILMDLGPLLNSEHRLLLELVKCLIIMTPGLNLAVFVIIDLELVGIGK
jgi:hypothetical protein